MMRALPLDHFGPAQEQENGNLCQLCRDAAEHGSMCRRTVGYLTCTRPKGHDGPHAACGSFHGYHPVRVWREEEP